MRTNCFQYVRLRAWLGVGSVPDRGMSPLLATGRSPNLTGFTSAVSLAEGSNFLQVPCVYLFHHSGIPAWPVLRGEPPTIPQSQMRPA